jgi:hypothetical protein
MLAVVVNNSIARYNSIAVLFLFGEIQAGATYFIILHAVSTFFAWPFLSFYY